MLYLLQTIRGLLGLFMFMSSVTLTFSGFPGALFSWLGGGVVMMGYTVAIASMTHEDVGNGVETAVTRILRSRTLRSLLGSEKYDRENKFRSELHWRA